MTMVAIIPLVTTAVKVSINVRSGVGNWEHDLTPFLRSVTDICAHKPFTRKRRDCTIMYYSRRLERGCLTFPPAYLNRSLEETSANKVICGSRRLNGRASPPD